MAYLSASSINQNGFQQLGSVIARRNADQAEQLAQSLKRQADAAQKVADAYEQKALSLQGQSANAQAASESARQGLNLSSSLRQSVVQLTNTINLAAAQKAAPSAQGVSPQPAAGSKNPGIGSIVNTKA